MTSPHLPKQFCAARGCGVLVERGRCAKHQRARTVEHRRYQHGDAAYSSRRWRRVRAAYLAEHPICVDCRAEGRPRLATEVDHVVSHRGDPRLFWDHANFAGRCKSHHSAKTWRETLAPRRGGKGEEKSRPGGLLAAPRLGIHGDRSKGSVSRIGQRIANNTGVEPELRGRALDPSAAKANKGSVS